MSKKILIVSLITVGVLLASQAEAANVFQKMFKRNSSSSTPVVSGKAWNADCIVKAIDKREASIGKAYNEMTNKISAALSARAKALSASWAQTDRNTRLASRNLAWKTFNDSAKQAREVHKVSVQGAWATYKSDAAACKMDVNGVEPENKEADL